jgi:hypothetical protein
MTAYAGQFIYAADWTDLDARLQVVEGADWITYVPTWSASGTQPASPASLTARYSYIGNRVEYQGKMTAGGSTTFGSSTWFMSLPVLASTAAVALSTPGACMILDAGTFRQPGTTILTTTDRISFIGLVAPGDVGSTRPMTWASGDELSWSIMYEPA